MTNFDPTTPRITNGTFTDKNQSPHELADLAFDKPALPGSRKTPRTYTANGFVQTSFDGQERVTRITYEEAAARWDAREPITYDQVRTAKTSGATFVREGEGEEGIDLDTFFEHTDYNSRARAGQPPIYWYRPLKTAKPAVAEIVPQLVDELASPPATAKERAALQKIREATADLKLEDKIGNFESWASDFTAVVINTETLKVVKRFRGESAWSDANRWAGDLHEQARRAERDSWDL